MPAKPQDFSHHTRRDPIYHFVIAPICLINVIVGIIVVVRNPGYLTAWSLVMAITLVLIVAVIRTYAAKVQDRVIRLEERVRLGALLPTSLQSRIPELTIDQLVALRFASDAELPALVERALRESLNRKQIKQAIVSWRADDWRV